MAGNSSLPHKSAIPPLTTKIKAEQKQVHSIDKEKPIDI